MIDKEQVLKLAKLSMVEFTENQLAAITADLENMVNFTSSLSNFTENVAELKLPEEPINAFRPDELFTFDVSRDELLQESKSVDDGFFKIPKSIEGR